MRQRKMGYSEVQQLSCLDSTEMVVEVDNRVKAFVLTINDVKSTFRPEFMETILEVIFKLTAEVQKPDNESPKRVLAEILSDRSAQFHMQLRRYINSSKGFNPKIATQLCKAFKVLLQILPDCSLRRLPIEELKMSPFYGTSFQILTQSVDELVELKANMNAKLQTNRIKDTEPCLSASVNWSNDEYRSIALLPSWEEVSIDKPPPQLRPNIVKGPYEDWMHYLDVHFRLLREDFVAPLRRGITAYLEGKKGKDLKGLRVYHSVQIIKPVYNYTGINFQVRFDNSHFHNCQWEHSKRLLFGSLLCLSPDNFKSIILFATVANRKAEDLRRGTFSIRFEQDYDTESLCTAATKCVMVESAAYFEASHHVMLGLQKAEVETMPFTRYIIKTDCTHVNPPKYLRDLASCTYNMSCLYGSQQSSKPVLEINVLNPLEWPKACDTELDQSQLDAIKVALTQEIAVIQGPPGTGKTYVGLKVVEALLCNRNKWDPKGKSPILVICYTNHALDQFLENILDIQYTQPDWQRFNRIIDSDSDIDDPRLNLHMNTIKQQPRVARVGGRCKNERINQFNVEQLLRCCEYPSRRNIQNQQYHCRQSMKDLQRELHVVEDEENIMNCDIDDPSQHSIMTLSELRSNHCIITPHVSQLRAHYSDQPGQEVEMWLGLLCRIEEPNESELDESCIQNYETHFSTSHEDYQHPTKTQQSYDSCSGFPPVTKHYDTSKPVTKRLDRDKSGHHSMSNDLNDLGTTLSEGEITGDDNNELIDVQGMADIEESNRLLTGDLLDFEPDIKDYKYEGSSYSGSLSSIEYALPIYHRKKEYEAIKRKYLYKEAMSPKQASDIHNLLDLLRHQRWQLYNYWLSQKKKLQIEKQKIAATKYSELCDQYRSSRQDAYYFVLEDQDVIGMTTTGVAKHHRVIQMLKPKVVVVEEAAEVMESHIISALCAGTQHLILIGDHMQLRPKPNEIKLASKYNLDVSLFERLVMNRIPHSTLSIQHRMRPEIAKLVHPHIYDTLYNHESVLNYDEIKGIAKNMFFIAHEQDEEENRDLLSPNNKHEARFMAMLCKYLLQQGYEASSITILTPYTGQLLELRNVMPRDDFKGICITVVDNFQGEENDIILLSLVRSNIMGKIGFLKHVNCICVALSRAKKGLYCIGNFTMLRQHSTIWDQILSDMETNGFIGEAIPLRCQNHPKITFTASSPKDFSEKAPDGGCTQPCQYRLTCGHVCSQKCHIVDKEHNNYKCRKDCQKVCDGGHKCPARCFESCPPCAVNVCKQIQSCGHKQDMPCHQDPMTFGCKAPCSKRCINGHPCRKLCSEYCGECKVQMMKTMTLCNHKQQILCCIDPASVPCKAKCLKQCVRGHPCQKDCYKPCGCEVTAYRGCSAILNHTHFRASRSVLRFVKMVTSTNGCVLSQSLIVRFSLRKRFHVGIKLT